jgi:hypothetical protein
MWVERFDARVGVMQEEACHELFGIIVALAA